MLDRSASPDEILASTPSSPEDFYFLAGFLAFRGSGWTNNHRHALVQKLQAHAFAAAPSVLARAEEFPRHDVLDAAEDALEPLAHSFEGISLLEEQVRSAPQEHIFLKQVSMRVLRHAPSPALKARAISLLTEFLGSDDLEERCGAIWPLVDLDALEPLARALAKETDPGNREELKHAVETFLPH